MVCRRRCSASEMTRAGRTLDGRWYVGRGAGRGMWWCSPACAQQLVAHHAQRALRTTLDEAAVATWGEFLKGVKTAEVVKE